MDISRRVAARFFLTLVWLLLFAGAGRAADHSNLEQDAPARVEDAYPIPYRALELMVFGAYEHAGGEGRHAGLLEPGLKWGAAKNAQVALAVPLVFQGDGGMEDSGNLAFEGLYNFTVETPLWPALALKAEFELPTGVDASGVDAALTAIATRGFGSHRFHLNAVFSHSGETEPGEREHRYGIGVGYDHPLGLDHLFVADFFVDRSPLEGGDEEFTGNLGVRKQLNPWSVLGLGVGTGFGSGRTPDLRATVALQWSL